MKGKILRGRSVKRVLSVVFALAMIFTMLPLSNMTVHAESTTEKPTVLLGWNLTYTGDNWWFVAYTNRWFCCSDAEGLGIKLDESSTDNFMINNSWIDNTELVAGTYTCGHCGATLTLSPNTPTHTAAACEGRYFYENEVEFWCCDKGDRISVGDILSGNIKFDKLGDSSSYLDSVEMSSEDLLSNALVVKIDGDKIYLCSNHSPSTGATHSGYCDTCGRNSEGKEYSGSMTYEVTQAQAEADIKLVAGATEEDAIRIAEERWPSVEALAKEQITVVVIYDKKDSKYNTIYSDWFGNKWSAISLSQAELGMEFGGGSLIYYISSATPAGSPTTANFNQLLGTTLAITLDNDSMTFEEAKKALPSTYAPAERDRVVYGKNNDGTYKYMLYSDKQWYDYSSSLVEIRSDVTYSSYTTYVIGTLTDAGDGGPNHTYFKCSYCNRIMKTIGDKAHYYDGRNSTWYCVVQDEYPNLLEITCDGTGTDDCPYGGPGENGHLSENTNGTTHNFSQLTSSTTSITLDEGMKTIDDVIAALPSSYTPADGNIIIYHYDNTDGKYSVMYFDNNDWKTYHDGFSLEDLITLVNYGNKVYVIGTVNEEESHTHNFAEGWTTDDDYHWHACTAEGNTDDCLLDEAAAKAAHSWDDGVVTTKSTYDANGVKTYTCTVCSQTKTEEIPQLTHKYAETWSMDEETHWHACTDEGYTDLKKDEAAHTWDDGVVTTEATLEAAGVKTYTCTECEKTRTEEIPQLKGTYDEVETAGGKVENITGTDKAPNEKNALNANVSSDDFAEALGITDTEKTEGVNLWLTFTDASDSMSDADKKLIEDAKDNKTVGMLLNVSMFKKVGEAAIELVTDLNAKVTISFVVPEELRKAGRTYKIVRVHNGVATVIDAEYDAETYTVSFETDAFSSYALLYADKSNVPPTGVVDYAGYAMGIMLIAMAATVVVAMKSRKKEEI